MKDPTGRYAQLYSGFPCFQSGYSTPPVLQSYHYSPMYSYTSPCSQTNYYTSCGSCPKKLSVTDAYSNDIPDLTQYNNHFDRFVNGYDRESDTISRFRNSPCGRQCQGGCQSCNSREGFSIQSAFKGGKNIRCPCKDY